MIYKLLAKNKQFLGGELRLTPVELLTVKDALREYTKNNEIHRTDRIIAQLMIKEMCAIEDEYKSS